MYRDFDQILSETSANLFFDQIDWFAWKPLQAYSSITEVNHSAWFSSPATSISQNTEMEDDIPGDVSTLASLPLPSGPVPGTIDFAGDEDWYKIDLIKDQIVVFEMLRGSSGDMVLADPELTLYDANANPIAYNNDYAGFPDARIYFVVETTGTYFLSAQAFGDATGSYDLDVNEIMDDFAGDATTIGRLEVTDRTSPPTSGILDYPDDFDWFKVTPPSGTNNIAFAVERIDPSLPYINFRLYDEAGELIDTQSGLTEGFVWIFSNPEDKPYFLSVSGDDNVGSYLIRAFELPDDYSGNSDTTGTVQIDSTSVSAEHEFEFDDDWFALTTTGNENAVRFTIESLGATHETIRLSVLDSEGENLLSNQSNAGTSVDLANIEAGIYYVSIQSLDGTGNYSFSAETLPDDFAGSITTTGSIQIDGSPVTAEIDFRGDNDWFAIDITEAGTIAEFLATGLDNAKRFSYGIFDENGVSLDNNRTPFEGDSFYHRFEDAGRYYLSVANSSSESSGTYRITNKSIQDDFGNDSSTDGVLLTDGTLISGDIEYHRDEDWFKFTVEQPNTVIGFSHDFISNSLGRLGVRIYDASENRLVNDTFNVHADTVYYEFEESGDYFFSVDNFTFTGSYSIFANIIEDDFSSNASDAGTLLVNGSVTTAESDYETDTDWFEFSVETPGEVVFANNLRGQANLRDAGGTIIVSITNDANFAYEFTDIGTYYLEFLPSELGSYKLFASTVQTQSQSIFNTHEVQIDAARNQVYFSTSASGTIEIYDFEGSTFLISLNLDGDIRGLSMSQDGEFLYAGQFISTDNGDGTYTNTIYEIDLDDFSVREISFISQNSANGIHDVQTTSDGNLLVVGELPGFARSALSLITNLDTVPDARFLDGNVSRGATLHGSPDGRYTLMVEAGSDMPFALFDAETDSIIARSNLRVLQTSGFNRELHAVSAEAGLIAISTDNNFLILDMDLNLVKDLSDEFQIEPRDAVAFSNDGFHMFTISGDEQTVRIYETETFELIGGIAIDRTFNLSTSFLEVSNDGQYLIVHTRSVSPGDNFFTLIDLENMMSLDVVGTGADDVINGGIGTDKLAGLEGADTIFGNRGDDFLDGGAGTDTIDGGDGTDTVSYASSSEAVSVNLEKNKHFFGDAGGDSLVSIENVIGSDFDDTIAGDGEVNYLTGGDGADNLRGLQGNDVIDGGAGADVIDGGGGLDTASYETSFEGVAVNLSKPTQFFGDAAGDTLIEIEYLTGSAFDDTLTGNERNNELFGLDGDDVMRGLNGKDILEGGAGADNLDGGSNIDIAAYTGSAEGVSVNLSKTRHFFGDANGDSLFNMEGLSGSAFTDYLTGDGFNNILIGNDGDDVLRGLNGSDIMDGGAGNDILTGGSNRDTFIFRDGEGHDTVVDLQARKDKLDMTGLTAFDTLDDVYSAATIVNGTDLLISIDSETSILFENTTLNDLMTVDIVLASDVA